MKVLFICSSLEPGKDGVGDYTRRLAAEFSLRGAQVLIISLKDKCVENGVIDEVQEFNNIPLIVKRFSNKLTNSLSLLNLALESYQPERVFLQFVIYGFHPKGLPYLYINKLSKILSNFQTSVMFHELWVGMEDQASAVHKIYRIFQIKIIKNLIQNLKPKKIFTNTDLYQYQIKEIGYNSEVLPLFSNILNKGIGVKEKDTFCVGFFGTIYSINKASKFICDLKNVCTIHDKRLKFKFIGKNGSLVNKWMDLLQKNNVEYSILGELSEMQISNELNACDLGVSTTPRLLFQKSGVFSTYVEHGLKIFVLDNEWDVKGYKLLLSDKYWAYSEKMDLDWNELFNNKLSFNSIMNNKEIFNLYYNKITSAYG